MVKISIPRQLMSLTNLNSDFETNADTIRAALDNLVLTYPMLKTQIFNSNKNIRNFVNIFLDEQMVENIDAIIPKKSKIQVIVAVAGG